MQQTWKVPNFKGATFMSSVRWQMYDKLKENFPNVAIHLTYGASTKQSRRVLHIQKSHINDVFSMSRFHPKHRTRHYLISKKRRNNRVLAKFYDAKYIDSRDSSKKSGQQLFNGRTKRNHKLDTENLHAYRAKKVSNGRTAVRKQHYSIQPGDCLHVDGKYVITNGCHCNGARVLCNGKSIAVKNVRLHKYAGGYIYENL